MKKFFNEFKAFIARGNIVDMAVGVIVGSSFTAIVNGLSNYILKPLINFLLALIFKTDSLSGIYTMLKPAYVIDENGLTTAEIDLANSIFIDWGSFISAILNFFLVALVLFIILRTVNRTRAKHLKYLQGILDNIPTKEEKKEMKKLGIKLSNEEAVKAFLEQKKAEQKAKEEAAKKEAEEKARLERLNNPTTEDLLKEILKEIKNK